MIKTILKNLYPISYILGCTIIPLKCKKKNNLSEAELLDRAQFATYLLDIRTPVQLVQVNILFDRDGNPSNFLEGMFDRGETFVKLPINNYILFHELVHHKQYEDGIKVFKYHPWAAATFSNNTPFFKKYIGRIMYWLTDFELEAEYCGYRIAQLYDKHKQNWNNAKKQFKNRVLY